MNKLLLSLSTILISGLSTYAQRTINYNNVREGENVEYCFEHVMLERVQTLYPEVYQAYISDVPVEVDTNEPKPISSNQEKSSLYRIPVVFHILHQNGEENISDEQIFEAMEILNRDYDLQNADANNVHPDFDGIPADVEIEFALATIAPNGTCFKGITRTVTATTFNGDNGFNQVNAVVAGNDVYQGVWPHNKYLNVFVCDDIGGAAGYTFNPGGGSSASAANMYFNGIFLLHNYTGASGTSSVYSSRTLTHEVGHWLNLEHTWGPNNDPGTPSSCGTDDGVTDTPNTIGVTTCNLNEMSCGPRANVENYMDYSYCSKMFTPGQVTRMQNAINSSTAGRSNLKTTANLNAVGANGDLELCRADFKADKTIICVGDQVQFTDQTYNAATGWNWTFTGGTPSTSISENPVVTYNTPGTYTVTLNATDGSNNDGETKTSYITVLSSPGSLPFFEGFENYTTLDAASGWFVNNPGGNAAFTITNTTAHSGSKSVKLGNFGQTGENFDELEASAVDLSNATVNNTVLSFRYAYRRTATNNQEYLKVYFTSDCGDNWVMKKTMSAAQLASGSAVVTSNWTPASAADWTTVHMDMNNSSYEEFMVDNFRYKFTFDGKGGNNLFIDDINIYAGDPSDELVLGLENLAENGLHGVNIYPNPGEQDMNISFTVDNNQAVEISVQDITGKVISIVPINAITGNNLVMIDASEFAQGVYFVNIKVNNASKAYQYIKK